MHDHKMQFKGLLDKRYSLLFTMLIVDQSLHDRLRYRPDYHFVSRYDGTFIYYYDPAYYEEKEIIKTLCAIEQHLFKGVLSITEVVKAMGDPGLVVDGHVPPDGVAWNSPQCLILSDMESSITIEVPDAPIEGLLVSADNNDSYQLLCSSDGSHFKEIGIIPVQLGPAGVRVRMFFSENLSSCRYIRITPQSGDGFFSIGEIGFLVRDQLPVYIHFVE